MITNLRFLNYATEFCQNQNLGQQQFVISGIPAFNAFEYVFLKICKFYRRKVIFWIILHILGWPCICIKMTLAPVSDAAFNAPSPLNASTSFIISAPRHMLVSSPLRARIDRNPCFMSYKACDRW